MSIERTHTLYKEIEQYIFKYISANKGDRINSTVRVNKRNKDNKGVTEWFYWNEDINHDASDDSKVKYDNDGIYDDVILSCSSYHILTLPQISAAGCASFYPCKNVQGSMYLFSSSHFWELLKVEKEQECLDNTRRFVNSLPERKNKELYQIFLFLSYITRQSLVKPWKWNRINKDARIWFEQNASTERSRYSLYMTPQLPQLGFLLLLSTFGRLPQQVFQIRFLQEKADLWHLQKRQKWR